MNSLNDGLDISIIFLQAVKFRDTLLHQVRKEVVDIVISTDTL